MKQYCFLFIFILLFLHTGCVGKISTAKQPTEAEIQIVSDNAEGKAETDTQTLTVNDERKNSKPLIIGGKQYKGLPGEKVRVGNVVRIPGEPKDCTVEDIDSLFYVSIWVNPEDHESKSSLQNLELLYNIKDLTIRGKNLDKVDFSPISLLAKLEKLEIEGNITRMPDMTNLKQLREVEIKGGALKSLEGINGTGIERLSIESPESNSNIMLKISDMKNLANLEVFAFKYAKIDLGGIDLFTSLKIIALRYCEPYNINSIGNIKNLEVLDINLVSENPSLEFLKNMPNLDTAFFFGNFHLYDYTWEYDYKPTHVLDVTPLATSKKLEDIVLINFVIKNISALDVLEFHASIYLVGSRLYDKTEKSRHSIQLERDGR